MRDEGFDGWGPEDRRVPAAAENDEPPNPANILLLGAVTVVTYAKGGTHLVEEARFSGHAALVVGIV